jgi:hypothetical protein
MPSQIREFISQAPLRTLNSYYMKKFNRKYLSFFEFIKILISRPSPERYDDGADEDVVGLLYKGSMPLYVIYPRYQFLGTLRPFAKMAKDFVDTFRPYYSTGKIKRDLLQPIRGVANILRGIASIVGGAIALVLWWICLPIAVCLPTVYLPQIIYPLSWLMEGVGEIVRGATQLIATPLIFIKLPLRGLLTYLQKEKKFVEDKPEIQRLAEEAKSILPQLNQGVDLPMLPDAYSEEQKFLEVIRSSEYKNAREKNVLCNKHRKRFVALLSEIDRKYMKSIKDGWSPRPEPKEAKLLLHDTYSARSSADLREAKQDIQVPLLSSVSALGRPPTVDGLRHRHPAVSIDAASTMALPQDRLAASARQPIPTEGSSSSIADDFSVQSTNPTVLSVHKSYLLLFSIFNSKTSKGWSERCKKPITDVTEQDSEQANAFLEYFAKLKRA